ncbi:MAG: hypothetical protein KDK44_03245 [Chlamydiia bacterium]|nr:hypothetical protein [Chlamydiia bacterium]
MAAIHTTCTSPEEMAAIHEEIATLVIKRVASFVLDKPPSCKMQTQILNNVLEGPMNNTKMLAAVMILQDLSQVIILPNDLIKNADGDTMITKTFTIGLDNSVMLPYLKPITLNSISGTQKLHCIGISEQAAYSIARHIEIIYGKPMNLSSNTAGLSLFQQPQPHS